MRVVQATDRAVSIWFSGEAAPDRGALLALVRQALAERGLSLWPDTEAEQFTAGADTLVIARPAHHGRLTFYFEDLEALLGGALSCPDGPSALYDGGEGYVLAAERSCAGPGLYEYGRPAGLDGLWEAHAREQGRCIVESGAIAALRRYFSP